MRYYTSGLNIFEAERERTGEYDSLEEALVGLVKTAAKYEVGYLCIANTHHTLCYMYHSITKPRTARIKFNIEHLKEITP